jgi:TM2 domain-containing membrane protein YozV
MKKSTKGILLSGLVYPGVGQLILGHVASGIVFIILATAGLIVLIYRFVQRAFHVVDQLLPLLADNRLDVVNLNEKLSVHAYFVGKKIDGQFR